MNKYVRIGFFPIMILAGIFTVTMCSLITAPIAFYHWLKERRLAPQDLANDEKYIAKFQAGLTEKQQH